jgi:ACS family hexuronate transporter-like MFS transporter
VSKVTEAKVGKFRYAILSANVLVLILNYIDRAAVGVAAPFIIHEFGFSLATFGVIMSVFAITYAPACFLGGWASDRWGPRKVMGAAVIWWSLLTAATGACFNLVTFGIQRLCFGLGEGPQGAVTARTMSNWFPKKEYGTAVGLAFASNPLGAAVGAPLVAWLIIASGNNWRFPFLVLGALGLVIGVIWFVVVRDDPRKHPAVSKAEADFITSSQVQLEEAEAHGAKVPSLGYFIKQPAVLGNAFAFFSYAWMLYTFLSWYPVFLMQSHHIDLKTLAWAGAIPWVAGAAGNFLGGFFSDKLAERTGSHFKTRKWIAVVALGLAGCACIPLGVVSTATGAVGLLTVTLFLLYVANTQFFALVRDTVHPKRLGATTGFVHFCANCAAFIAPAATGFLVQGLHSWVLAFGLSAGLCILGALALAATRKPAMLEPASDDAKGHPSEPEANPA